MPVKQGTRYHSNLVPPEFTVNLCPRLIMTCHQSNTIIFIKNILEFTVEKFRNHEHHYLVVNLRAEKACGLITSEVCTQLHHKTLSNIIVVLHKSLNNKSATITEYCVSRWNPSLVWKRASYMEGKPRITRERRSTRSREFLTRNRRWENCDFRFVK